MKRKNERVLITLATLLPFRPLELLRMDKQPAAASKRIKSRHHASKV